MRIRNLLLAAITAIMPLSSQAESLPLGSGIHPDDFQVFSLDGRLLFVDDRPILALIGTFEGPDGYDTVYYGSRIKPPKPITTMTIEEVQQWQDRSVDAGSKSSAAGVYQFIRNSLRDAAKNAGIPRTELFSRYNQDRLARDALSKCGFYKHTVPDEKIGDCVARVWAALPLITGPNAGKSAYDGVAGNKSLTSVDTVMRAIRGRFRDIAYSDGLRGKTIARADIQEISPSAPVMSFLPQQAPALPPPDYITFSLAEPDQIQAEVAEKEVRRERFRASLDERARRIQPFYGYVKSERAEKTRYVSN